MTNWEKLTSELVEALQKSCVRELAEYLQSTRRLIAYSFISGIFKGLGSAIGFSVLGAIALLLIGRIFGMDFTK